MYNNKTENSEHGQVSFFFGGGGVCEKDWK